jgi:16S rRNA (guanine966-N2)-methyltransferase
VPDAGRVIAGSARGIRLKAAGPGTRSLGDRVKQTLFAILEPELPGTLFLDLFAGSGAAGIEALSRGAEGAVFVERDARAVAAIKANLETTGLAGPNAVVIQADVVPFIGRPLNEFRPFGVVFADPPYARSELVEGVLRRLGSRGTPLTHDARVVVKHFWRDRPEPDFGLLASEREERFGESALTFYRLSRSPEEGA